MVMTPQEIHAAFMARVEGRDEAGFMQLCEQLRSGELVVESHEEGYIIRAAKTAPQTGEP